MREVISAEIRDGLSKGSLRYVKKIRREFEKELRKRFPEKKREWNLFLIGFSNYINLFGSESYFVIERNSINVMYLRCASYDTSSLDIILSVINTVYEKYPLEVVFLPIHDETTKLYIYENLRAPIKELQI